MPRYEFAAFESGNFLGTTGPGGKYVASDVDPAHGPLLALAGEMAEAILKDWDSYLANNLPYPPEFLDPERLRPLVAAARGREETP